MPHYYFHVRKDETLEEDPKGAEFANLALAKEEAVKAAREILVEKLVAGGVVDGARFEITFEDGAVLDVIPFRSTIRLE